jgi:hypothetical protein
MSNGEQGAVTPQKKGLSPLAWVGIGCGVVVLIVIVVLVALSFFVVHKAKQAGFDPALWAKNPAVAASKMIATLNPELEVVKVDEDAGIITVRNKKTGEVVTVNLDDLKKGKVSFKSLTSGKEVHISAEAGEKGGGVKVTDEKGKTVLAAGSGSSKLPDWVPVYPGTEPKVGFSMTEEKTQRAVAAAETDASLDEVFDFFASKLEAEGYSVRRIRSSTADTNSGMVIATKEAEKKSVQVGITREDNRTKIAITFSGPVDD